MCQRGGSVRWAPLATSPSGIITSNDAEGRLCQPGSRGEGDVEGRSPRPALDTQQGKVTPSLCGATGRGDCITVWVIPLRQGVRVRQLTNCEHRMFQLVQLFKKILRTRCVKGSAKRNYIIPAFLKNRQCKNVFSDGEM